MNAGAYAISGTLAGSPGWTLEFAVRRRDGKAVILKRSAQEDGTFAQRIRRVEFEHRILRQLEGPGVIQTLGFERMDEEAVLVLEDFGIQPLPMGPRGVGLELFFTIACRIVDAVGYIHQRSVIHGDIRPRNIAVNPRTGEVRLANFQVASELAHERQDGHRERGSVASLPYSSPEQTGRMNREIDYRTDYYSLGVTLFELATGQLPFQANDAIGWAHCHISRRPPHASALNPELPVMVSEIIDKLLSKEPEERYQSARGLIADLERCRTSWLAARSIDRFQLASLDVPERFEVCRRIVGRDRELGSLLEAFEATSLGATRLLLVSGSSGVGKSSLVREVHKPIVERHGYFVSGKFDQLERNLPYAALVEGFRGLIQQLLAEPEERLAGWRARLTAALGQNLSLLVDLVPELEPILGRGSVAVVGPGQAQTRVTLAFHEFIRVFAQLEHPLVLFLDDLQWADASTLDLLVDLFAAGGVGHLLVIGAYRHNEVSSGDPLDLALKEIKLTAPNAIAELFLSPLDEAAVGQLVTETLRCGIGEAIDLTRLIFEKTAGNPFFINELLSSLHRDGVFHFDPLQGRWDWDVTRLKAIATTANVVDLLVSRLRELPVETQALLHLAACLGHEFDLAALAAVFERTADETGTALWPMLARGILVPLDSNYRLLGGTSEMDGADVSVRYRFMHDRVQQAAYALPTERERMALHLKVGRTLLASTSPALLDERVFDIVNHLNLARELVDDPAEQALLMRLNLRAAHRAKRAAAFSIAMRYFENATLLLTVEQLGVDSALRFGILRDWAECAVLAGEATVAERLCGDLLDIARTPLEQGAAYSLKALILEHGARLTEAVAATRQGLARLGVVLPDDPAAINQGIGAGIAKMQAHLERVQVEDLAKLPQMVDREKIMIMNLLAQVIPPAIQTNPPLFILAELMMFDLALTAGTTAVSCKNFVDCGIIQGGILGNFEVAYRLGQTAFELLKRYAPTPLESAVHFVFGAFVSHWRAPFREGLESYALARLRGVELGDVQHAAYAFVHRIHRLFLVGAPLEECRSENQSAVDFLTRAHAPGHLLGASVSIRAVAALTGSDGSHDARLRADEEAWQSIERGGNAQWLYSYGQAQTAVHFLLGDLETAERWQQATNGRVAAGSVLFSVPDFYLFKALLLTRRWGALPESERAAALQQIIEVETKLQGWAAQAPANFGHKHRLLVAERARISGGPLEIVLRLYDEAHDAAGEDFVQMRALCRELQAEYCLAKDCRGLGRAALLEAHRLYARWGARAKLTELEGRYVGWFETRAEGSDPAADTTANGDGALDLASVLKATQVISGEVRSERLFARLMDAIVENAGAQRGCLVLRSEVDQRFYVEARSDVEGIPGDRANRVLLDDAEDVSVEVVRYVVRTRNPLVLDDAVSEGPFQADPHIRRRRVRSVLCMPILRQGEMLAVLYVENNALRRAFTNNHLDVMRVLSSQAAISITNAHLYESLERKVIERTAELDASRRQFQALIESVNGVPWEMELESLRFTYVGPQGESLLGYSQAEWLVPSFFEQRLHQEDRIRTLTALRTAVESGQGQDLEFRLLTRNDGLVWARNVLTVRDFSGQHVLRGMILDQTNRKRLEAELQQAQKLESVGRLAAGIAHEINTPIQFVSDSVHFVGDAVRDLTAVIQRYHGLHQSLALDPRWAANVREMADADEAADLPYLLENVPVALERSLYGLTRVASIVKSMKAFAHPDQRQQVLADINQAVESTLIMAYNEYKYVADVKLDLGDLPMVPCHSGDLSQVILNIVVNAAHAIGDIVGNSGDKGLITVRTWREAHEAVIAIGDTGRGIPDSIRERIFDPFFTTKEVGRGTGQGLAIARTAIVEKHGGTLTFETESGKGSVFYIRLPIAGKISPLESPPLTDPPAAAAAL